jgi:hypothetical protein
MGVHSVREFGAGRGGTVLETGDMSGGVQNIVQAEHVESGEDAAACLIQGVVVRCRWVESQGRG